MATAALVEGAPAGEEGTADPRRWWVLGVVGLAQLMITLDLTVMNIALPSAQRALGFSDVDRQWVITAYALSFGSLLLFGGRLGDLLGRKLTFLTGLAGFAFASAVGGASTSFVMLVAARACQGAFAALLAPAALSLLTTTFAESKERGRAFAMYGAIAGGGGLLGLLLGGVLTEYLDWRWCLYLNLIVAAVTAAGAVTLLSRQRPQGRVHLDLPGAGAVSGAMFCLVYGLSNAASHDWATPSTWAFLVAGACLWVAFAAWQARAAHPLLPPRVALDRNRGAAYLTVLVIGAAMFGLFLFLTYYLQGNLGYSPVRTGVAFLPAVAMLVAFAQLSNIVLMPRVGPKLIVPTGLLTAAAGMAWLAGIGVHSGYVAAVLGPLLVGGAGIGAAMPAAMNSGTYGVAAEDAGVASATLNVGSQLGGSAGTALLNTMATSSSAAYVAAYVATLAPGSRASHALLAAAAVHGYTTAFWWAAALFAGGALIAGALFRWGPPGRRPARTTALRPDRPGTGSLAGSRR